MIPKRLTVLGVRIDAVRMDDIMDWVRESIRSKIPNRYLVVVNVAKLIKAREDPYLRSIIEGADLVGVDGMPLVWYSRVLPQHLPEKVSGIDIMMTMFRTGDKEGWSFFFLGATEKVVQCVVEKCRREYPGARIAGYQNGYFKREDEEQVVETIRKSGANILLIAFGSPHKEKFVERWKAQLGVNVIHGVGGSFDVYAGIVKRAPGWMQSAGLEWLYRFLQEPSRLFLRYAVSNSKFALLVVRDRLGILGPPSDG